MESADNSDNCHRVRWNHIEKHTIHYSVFLDKTSKVLLSTSRTTNVNNSFRRLNRMKKNIECNLLQPPEYKGTPTQASFRTIQEKDLTSTSPMTNTVLLN